jgi:hypothetical protein
MKNLCKITLLLAIAVAIWYDRLSEREKQNVQNFVKQIPDLPGRYMV